MKINTKPYKGARDFYPEDMRFQNWMFDKWRRAVEKFGYQEYSAPMLERTELYTLKGSEEIVSQQSYTFEDRGKRSVTIRTEMTPSVSRMIAGRRQEVSYPARWYSIPNLWRYERMQRGRLREFWQLNVDLFGVSSMQAEIEMIMVMDAIMQGFKAKRSSYSIRLNSRKLVDAFLEITGISQEQALEVVRLADKLNKLETSVFAQKLDDITSSQEISLQIIKFLGAQDLEDLPEVVKSLDSYKDLKQVIGSCKGKGIRNVEFDVSIMRGFDYYTDIVFEVFDTDPDNNRSMFGGGRYDGLVAQFGAESVPTIGFGMGDVTFQNFLEANKLVPKMRSSVDVTVLLQSPEAATDALRVADELREIGANASIDLSGRKLDKQIKAADKNGTRYVVIVAEQDEESEVYTLKDIVSGKQQRHSVSRIVSIVKDSRT